MEAISSIVLHGCKIASDLETNLLNLMQYPPSSSSGLDLINSCDNIIRVFTTARDLLATQLTHHGILLSPPPLPPPPMPQPLDIPGSSSSRSTSTSTGISLQRTRKSNVPRKSQGDRKTIMVSAPQFGNTDIPPEDGYTWRKYGQKEIYGSRFPRSYYRCTHQKLYKCPAKKQVQRTDSNPLMYEVIYRNQHTCHMSSTAPTHDPPMSTTTISYLQVSTAATPQHVPAEAWLSMDIRPSMAMCCTDFVGPSSHTTTTTTDVGGTVKYANDQGESTDVTMDQDYYQGLLDLAERMINTEDGATSNSMDLIFPNSTHPNNN